ncbi:MAG: hypothetical protein IPQ07_14875 [Myxococcales bacterium]|nr:hypothetical protein [Myxococcales bacterium]
MSLHPNHASSSPDHHFFEEQLDAIKDGVKKLAAQVSHAVKPEPSRIRSFADKATELVREHPIAVAGIALGVGYLAVRIARR